MKTKAIIFSLLVLLGVGMTTTSCEDMFTPENSLVETDLTPADTLYQMMGIVRGMQKVIDKSIILGEVRADLVDINAYTTTDLQELSKNNVSDANAYNTPSVCTWRALYTGYTLYTLCSSWTYNTAFKTTC